MTKTELAAGTMAALAATHDALQLLWDSINKGQRKQLAKREEIRAVLDRYGVEYEE